MLHKIIYAYLEHSLNRTYSDRLAIRGTTPSGVFWRNKSTQIARFEALLSVVKNIAPTPKPLIADIGCGYGAMLDFIEKTPRYKAFSYIGVDINRSMIAACKKRFPDQEQLFTVGKFSYSNVDFSLFSGTFNLCHTEDVNLWSDYIFTNLKKSWQRSRYGLALNLLCAPTSHVKNHIFYADRHSFITRASKTFGPTYAVSTLHVSNDVTFVISRD